MYHQTHQVYHQVKLFTSIWESCLFSITHNTKLLDDENDTLDETLDTLDENDDTLDENTYQSIRIFLKLIQCLIMNCL